MEKKKVFISFSDVVCVDSVPHPGRVGKSLVRIMLNDKDHREKPASVIDRQILCESIEPAVSNVTESEVHPVYKPYGLYAINPLY